MIHPWTSTPSLAVNQNSSGSLIFQTSMTSEFRLVSRLEPPASWTQTSWGQVASVASKAILEESVHKLNEAMVLLPSMTGSTLPASTPTLYRL